MSDIKLSPMIMREAKVASSKQGLSLYEGTLSLVAQMLVKNTHYQLVNIKPIIRQTEIIRAAHPPNKHKLEFGSMVRFSQLGVIEVAIAYCIDITLYEAALIRHNVQVN